MKKTIPVIIVLGLIFALGIGFGGDKKDKNAKKELSWLSFDSAKTVAGKENKKILVDVYTDWCGWCKKMDRDTYSDTRVMKYLNDSFVVAKLNPELDETVVYKGKEISNGEFAQSMGIHGYPTLLFFDSSGEVITGLSSYLKADDFLHVAHYVGDDIYKNMKWEEYQATLKN